MPKTGMPGCRSAGWAIVGAIAAKTLFGLAVAQPLPPEALARQQLDLALGTMQLAMCDGVPCAPATEDEKRNPPISIAEAQKVISRGVLSGIGAHCHLDWQRQNFMPMMAYWRHAQRKSARQMALVALLHGLSQAQAERALAPQPCTDRQRAEIQAKLAFQP
jgi:hypothetical protein